MAPTIVQVTNISGHCFWLLLGDEEIAVPFAAFPWFKCAAIDQITTVEWPSADHLFWPLLDVDLSVHSLREPGAFPLVSGAAT